MDGLDADIIRQVLNQGSFQWDFRASWADVAKALGIDEETVRLRIKKLEAEGVLERWDLIVNPPLLGRVFLRLVTQVVEGVDKEEAIARIGLIDGVLWIFDHMGPGFGVVAMVEPGGTQDRLAELVRSITRGPTTTFPVSTAPPTISLSPRDWRLVAALRKGPRDRFADIAERAGMSEKTVRRRVEEFVEGRASFLNARIDFGRARGVIPVEVKVGLKDPGQRGPLDAYLQRLPNRSFSRYDGSVSQQSFMAETIGEVEDVRRRVKEFPGTEWIRVEVTTRRPVFDAWLDEQIERRAAAA